MCNQSNHSEHERIAALEAQVPQIAEQVSSLTTSIRELSNLFAIRTSAGFAGVSPIPFRPVLFDPGYALALPFFAPPPRRPKQEIKVDRKDLKGRCDAVPVAEYDLEPGDYFVDVQSKEASTCNVFISAVRRADPTVRMDLPTVRPGGAGGGDLSLAEKRTLQIQCGGGGAGCVFDLKVTRKLP